MNKRELVLYGVLREVAHAKAGVVVLNEPQAQLVDTSTLDRANALLQEMPLYELCAVLKVSIPQYAASISALRQKNMHVSPRRETDSTLADKMQAELKEGITVINEAIVKKTNRKINPDTFIGDIHVSYQSLHWQFGPTRKTQTTSRAADLLSHLAEDIAREKASSPREPAIDQLFTPAAPAHGHTGALSSDGPSTQIAAPDDQQPALGEGKRVDPKQR